MNRLRQAEHLNAELFWLMRSTRNCTKPILQRVAADAPHRTAALPMPGTDSNSERGMRMYRSARPLRRTQKNTPGIAGCVLKSGVPTGIRTPVATVKG